MQLYQGSRSQTSVRLLEGYVKRVAHNYPFEMLSHDAKLTLVLAQKESEKAGQPYIGSEHVLLGLLGVEAGQAARVLKRLKVTIDRARRVISRSVPQGKPSAGKTPIPTTRVKRLIEIAFDEARRMGHTSVDTGHLLIGLVIEGEGIGRLVLEDLGAAGERVVAEVERELEAPPTGRTLRTRPLSAPQTKGLGDPPPKVAALRDKLASVRFVLRHAIEAQDSEHARRLATEENRLERELANAEQEWIDSLA